MSYSTRSFPSFGISRRGRSNAANNRTEEHSNRPNQPILIQKQRRTDNESPDQSTSQQNDEYYNSERSNSRNNDPEPINDGMNVILEHVDIQEYAQTNNVIGTIVLNNTDSLIYYNTGYHWLPLAIIDPQLQQLGSMVNMEDDRDFYLIAPEQRTSTGGNIVIGSGKGGYADGQIRFEIGGDKALTLNNEGKCIIYNDLVLKSGFRCPITNSEISISKEDSESTSDVLLFFESDPETEIQPVVDTGTNNTLDLDLSNTDFLGDTPVVSDSEEQPTVVYSEISTENVADNSAVDSTVDSAVDSAEPVTNPIEETDTVESTVESMEGSTEPVTDLIEETDTDTDGEQDNGFEFQPNTQNELLEESQPLEGLVAVEEPSLKTNHIAKFDTMTGIITVNTNLNTGETLTGKLENQLLTPSSWLSLTVVNKYGIGVPYAWFNTPENGNATFYIRCLEGTITVAQLHIEIRNT